MCMPKLICHSGLPKKVVLPGVTIHCLVAMAMNTVVSSSASGLWIRVWPLSPALLNAVVFGGGWLMREHLFLNQRASFYS